MRSLVLGAIVLSATALSAAEPFTITAPADGTVLRGGSIATISWTPTSALPRGVEEWEAFLSVDGGHYYSTRITPHLDIDVRTFDWHVPNVSSGDVRLLVRMGDEREELSYDVPLRFSIVASADAFFPTFVPIAKSRGESARPGDPGVVEWAAGDRGGHQVHQERAPVEQSMGGWARVRKSGTHAVVRAPAVALSRSAFLSACGIAKVPQLRGSSPLFTRDILLLDRRRNI